MKNFRTVRLILYCLFFCYTLLLPAQRTIVLPAWGENPADTASFVNSGMMSIDAGSIMYVEGNMQMLDEVGIYLDWSNPVPIVPEVRMVLDGTLSLEGSFVHDAVGNVFAIENGTPMSDGSWTDWTNRTKPRGISSSTGILKFVTDAAANGLQRHITSSGAIDRRLNYIAFPNLVFDTNDTIILPSIMGIDARTIKRANGKAGVLYLVSDVHDAIENPGVVIVEEIGYLCVECMVFDASLRITGDNGDYTVDEWAVIVEKRVVEYRDSEALQAGAVAMLMPFAAPFTAMRSGYFAGNWVRQPLLTLMPTTQCPVYNSYYYPYGNMPSASNPAVIDHSQYVIDPNQKLIPGNPYLLRLMTAHPVDDTYGSYMVLNLTAGENHDLDKFIFNGTPYQNLVRATDGKLFAGTPILNQTVQINRNNSQNWVVGNSYTSGINGQAIADWIIDADAYYYSTIWTFQPGATKYEANPIWDYDANAPITAGIPDIHAMSVFMIAATSKNTIAENVKIGPEYQIHTGGIIAPGVHIPGGNNLILPSPKLSVIGIGGGNNSRRVSETAQADLHLRNAAASGNTAASDNVLTLVLTPDDNPFVYSRTHIKLSATASETTSTGNVAAMPNPSRKFSLTGYYQGTQLQVNALPFSAKSAALTLEPSPNYMPARITVFGAESMSTEIVWLHDKKEGIFINLKTNSSSQLKTASANLTQNTYDFVLAPDDKPDRFEILFVADNLITTPVPETDLAESWKIHKSDNELLIFDLNDALLNANARIFGVQGTKYIEQSIFTVPQQRVDISQLPKGVYLLQIDNKTVKFVK